MARRWDGPLWHTDIGHQYMKEKYVEGRKMLEASLTQGTLIGKIFTTKLPGLGQSFVEYYGWPYGNMYSGVNVDEYTIAEWMWVYDTVDTFKMPTFGAVVDHPTGWGVAKACITEGQAFAATLIGPHLFGYEPTLSVEEIAEWLGLDDELKAAKKAVKVLAQGYYEVGIIEGVIQDATEGEAGGYWKDTVHKLDDGSFPKRIDRSERLNPRDKYWNRPMPIMVETVRDRLEEVLWLHFNSHAIRFVLAKMEVVDTYQDSPVGGTG